MRIGNSYIFHKDVIYHPTETKPYMKRWKLFDISWLGGIRLQKILRGDKDRHLHDHPWSFVSIILVGAYIEEKLGDNELQVHNRTLFNVCHYKSWHRIKAVICPTWTLVFHGPKRNDWGFWISDPENIKDGYKFTLNTYFGLDLHEYDTEGEE